MMSLHLSRKHRLHFWQEIPIIKVIKCLPNSSTQRDKNSKPKPNLKDQANTNSNPQITKRWFKLRLSGHCVTFIKIEHESNYRHFWTYR